MKGPEPNSGMPWSQEHLDILVAERAKSPPTPHGKICEMLGRSNRGVRRMLHNINKYGMPGSDAAPSKKVKKGKQKQSCTRKDSKSPEAEDKTLRKLVPAEPTNSFKTPASYPRVPLERTAADFEAAECLSRMQQSGGTNPTSYSEYQYQAAHQYASYTSQQTSQNFYPNPVPVQSSTAQAYQNLVNQDQSHHWVRHQSYYP